MARRNANLAGLAALGALGYKLAQGKGAPVEDRVGTPVSRDDQDFAAMDAELATMRPQRGNPASEEVYAEDGSISPLRRNRETGDLYNPNMTPSAPAKSSTKKRSSASASAADMDQVYQGANTKSSRTAAASDDDLGRIAARYKTKKELERPQEQPIENLSGDFLPMGKMAKVMGRMVKPTGMREYSQPLLEGPRKQLTGPSKADLLARDRAARAAAREKEMIEENAKRYGLDPDAPGFEAASKAVKRGDDFVFKKGGSVKAKPAKKMASGGMTSSASKRADGIATKGKTKCKMY